MCTDTFSSNIVDTLYHLSGSLFKINPNTTNDKKKLIAITNLFCNKRPKGNTSMIIFQNVQQQIFFICMICPV